MINFRDQLIRCKVNGKGDTIVLLHGYLESIEIWSVFYDELVKNYRVISIDLPGHGKSALYSNNHFMEFMADVVKSVIDHLKIRKCFLIGHSMGGYVTLAFLEMYSHLLSGFSLFHSSPFADTSEKIANRNREIEVVKAGKVQMIYSEHVPKTFANSNVEKFNKEIEQGIEIAKNTSPEGIIAALNGMKSRLDKTLILKKTNLPFLFIHGLKDNFIPVDMHEKLELPKNNEVLLLNNSGHMGFIEEKEKCIDAIHRFMQEEIQNS